MVQWTAAYEQQWEGVYATQWTGQYQRNYEKDYVEVDPNVPHTPLRGHLTTNLQNMGWLTPPFSWPYTFTDI